MGVAVHVIAVGLNHKTAPVEIREQVTLGAERLPPAFVALKGQDIHEAVILSTCNRTEIYLLSEQYHAGVEAAVDVLVGGRDIDQVELRSHLYVHHGMEAVRHLFRVACGLDSLVLGETQILGQVREAYQTAVEQHAVGKYFHALFGQAIVVGKRAHTETEISQNAASVSYMAVELAKKVFHSLEGRKVLIIGAGKMSELTAKHLVASGVSQIVVANRTPEKAAALAALFGGKGVPMEGLGEWLAQVDVVISSTGAPHVVVTRQMVADAMRHRRHRPIFLFDIAVPRDVEPAAGDLEGVFLYNIDDLEAAVQANLRERQREARKVERIIDEEVAKFQNWLRTLDVVPVIKSLREKAEVIRQRELQRAFARMPDLAPRQREIIEAMTATMFNKLLNDPTLRLKEYAGADNGPVYAEAVARLFNLPVPDRGDERPALQGATADAGQPAKGR